MIKKRLAGKTIAAIGAITLISAGAAAAATGTVPSPFSSDKAKHVTAEHVPDVALENAGQHADDSNESATEPTEAPEATEAPEETVEIATNPTDDATESDANESDATEGGVGPDATGPAKFGLCTAFAAHQRGDDTDAVDESPTTSTDLPVPFQNLNDAATAAGLTVEEFCADATPGKSDSAPGHSDENPSATAPGRSGDGPSETPPPSGNDENPSATAPGHNGKGPSDKAPGSSGEHGSGHAGTP